MKHTPTPWTTPGTDGESRVVCAILKGKRRTLAHVYGGDGTAVNIAQRDANTEYIVLAANCHDDLIAALQPIAAAYPDDPGTSDLDNEQPVTITLGDVRRVWAALGKAGAR